MSKFTKVFLFVFALGLFIAAASGVQWGTEEAGSAIALSAVAGLVAAVIRELIVG